MTKRNKKLQDGTRSEETEQKVTKWNKSSEMDIAIWQHKQKGMKRNKK